MKWRKKGHEFDEYAEFIKGAKKIYIFGAGVNGKVLTDSIHHFLQDEIEIVGFIDNNPKKQGTMYLERKVYGLHEVEKGIPIVIAVACQHVNTVMAQLIAAGYCEKKNIFTFQNFLTLYCAYVKEKVFFPYISVIPSTVCNLNCKACLNFTPYIKKHYVRTFEEVKADIDLFFSCVDYVGLFYISGGEPLLYKNLNELIEYIGMNYRERINVLGMPTNATVLPDDKLLEALKKYEVCLTIDDYREKLPEKAERYNQTVKLLKESGVSFQENKWDFWIDIKPKETDNTHFTEEELETYFDACAVPWQDLRDKKLWACNYANYANVAGLSTVNEKDYYDLTQHSKERQMELVEFRLGYNERGYTEFCKNCSGYLNINKNIVEAGEQYER